MSRNKFYVIAPLADWAILDKLLKPYVPRCLYLVNEYYYLSPGVVLRITFRNTIKAYKYYKTLTKQSVNDNCFILLSKFVLCSYLCFIRD